MSNFLSNNPKGTEVIPLELKEQELQRNFEWQILMPNMIANIDGMVVSKFCQEMKLGNYELSELSVMKYGVYQRAYAGLQSIRTIPVVFLADAGNLVFNYFTEWYYLMIDRDGYYYPKSNYAKTIFLQLNSRTQTPSIKFTIQGVFPKNKPEVPVIYTTGSGDVLRYNFELSIDQIVPEPF